MKRDQKRTVSIYVIEETSTGKGIRCSMSDDGEDTFFLAKSQIKPLGKVKKHAFCDFEIPEWMCLNHWQICGREAFEAEKERKKQWKHTNP